MSNLDPTHLRAIALKAIDRLPADKVLSHDEVAGIFNSVKAEIERQGGSERDVYYWLRAFVHYLDLSWPLERDDRDLHATVRGVAEGAGYDVAIDTSIRITHYRFTRRQIH